MPMQPRSRTGIFKPAARHVLHLGDLVDDLADRVEDEVGEHEVDDRPRAGHRRAARQARRSRARRSACRTAASGPYMSYRPVGRVEVAAALADPFAHHEDPRIGGHLFREGFERGLHERDLRAVRLPARCCRRAAAATDRTRRIDVRRRRRRVPARDSISANCRDFARPARRLRRRSRCSSASAMPSLASTVVAPQRRDRAARFPLFDLFARAIGEVAHPFGVRARAIGLAFDQRRRRRRPRPRHRLAAPPQ